MAKGNDAADAIKRLIKQNEQLKLAAEILDEYGSLDNAITEAKIKLESVKNELAGEVFKLAEAKESVENASNEILGLRKAAELDCTSILESAKSRAEAIEREAKDRASVTLIDAEERIRRKLANETGHMATLADKRVKLEAEIEALTVRHNEIKSSADEAADRLAKVKADIARIAGSVG